MYCVVMCDVLVMVRNPTVPPKPAVLFCMSRPLSRQVGDGLATVDLCMFCRRVHVSVSSVVCDECDACAVCELT